MSPPVVGNDPEKPCLPLVSAMQWSNITVDPVCVINPSTLLPALSCAMQYNARPPEVKLNPPEPAVFDLLHKYASHSIALFWPPLANISNPSPRMLFATHRMNVVFPPVWKPGLVPELPLFCIIRSAVIVLDPGTIPPTAFPPISIVAFPPSPRIDE